MSFTEADIPLLYRELAGTLSGGEDPAQPSTGSQCATYGYCAGNGTTLREKHSLYTKIQENGTGRPITVQRRARTAAGRVRTPQVRIQEITERIDLNELWEQMKRDTLGTDPTQLPRELSDLRWMNSTIMNNSPEHIIELTDEIEGKINQVFDATNWPLTRAALFEMLERPGSRSEEQYGVQVTLDNVREAEQWRITNAPGEPSLES